MAKTAAAPYDICIVGAGMVGSSIARHVTELAPEGYRVCLIGPPEPKKRVCVQGNEVFGAHYDEGRITGTLTKNVVWGNLAYRSMKRYKEIAEKSGIYFYRQSGQCLIGKKESVNITNRFQRNYYLTSAELGNRYPYISLGSRDHAVVDPEGGVINPRQLVNAEILIASQNGCDLVRDIVDEVQQVSTTYNDARMKIVTENGRVFWSRKVVLATNTFTTSRRLLPDWCKPVFEASPQTVVLGELDEENAHVLRDCPAISYTGAGGYKWASVYPLNDQGDVRFYLVPPIVYPDGKTYIKIGHIDDILKRYLKPEEISSFHCSGGDPWLIRSLTDLLKVIFPGIVFKSFKSDSCVTMVTGTNTPYIDMVHEDLGVAIGGNGHAAKSADEIGRLAACMMLKIDPGNDVNMGVFRLSTQNNNKSKL